MARRPVSTPEPVAPDAPQLPLEEGWTLPASWYREPAVYELERARIFSSAWQYAGPAEWVAEPGCFFTAQVGHVPIAVVRRSKDELRAFVNVCRHRGHLVVDGRGCRTTLQCPYHAWTYGLDGSLRKAPRSEREPGFDPEGLSLLPVSVGMWGPFVFVSPDPDAPPFDEWLGDLPAIVAGSGLDLDRVRFHSHHEWPIEANWKVVMENFLECYHCPTAHPGFSRVVDVGPDAYQLDIRPTFSSQRGSLRGSAASGNGRGGYVPRSGLAEAQYHLLFPVTTVNIAPGIANVGLERYVPDGPRRTIEVTDYYFGQDEDDDAIAELMTWDNQVGEEDVVLVQSVQRGLDAGLVPQGRLVGESEQLIADFQRKIHDALTA